MNIGITVRRNEAKNGIEISFDAKPTGETIEQLKLQGFRWHRAGKFWYAKQTPARVMFADILTAGSGGPEGPMHEDAILDEPQEGFRFDGWINRS